LTTKRELERKARHVYGEDATVTIKSLGYSSDGLVTWEVRAFSSRYTDAVRWVGRNNPKTRAEACEVLENKLAALDAGGWNWREP
jgi:hypothetical protein